MCRFLSRYQQIYQKKEWRKSILWRHSLISIVFTQTTKYKKKERTTKKKREMRGKECFSHLTHTFTKQHDDKIYNQNSNDDVMTGFALRTNTNTYCGMFRFILYLLLSYLKNYFFHRRWLSSALFYHLSVLWVGKNTEIFLFICFIHRIS